MTKFKLYWLESINYIEDYRRSVSSSSSMEDIEKHIKKIYPFGIRSGYKWIVWRKVVKDYFQPKN